MQEKFENLTTKCSDAITQFTEEEGEVSQLHYQISHASIPVCLVLHVGTEKLGVHQKYILGDKYKKNPCVQPYIF